MDPVSTFFIEHLIYVYFFYGLAFFVLGLVVYLESGRASEFRFARAMTPLALFGFVHGAHEWFEMFQIFATRAEGHAPGLAEEFFRIGTLSLSFLLLLAFGLRLLPQAEAQPRASTRRLIAFGAIWLAASASVYLLQRPRWPEFLAAADVLARYFMGIPGALLAGWALLRERRDFHARGMSVYGQGLLWAALAFFIYGAIGQLFVRPSTVFPSQVINSVLFLQIFGFPVQLLRMTAAAAIAITLSGALRAFEAESRIRLARANKARIEAQAAALQAQERRANEVEALNRQLQATARDLSAMVELARILTSTVNLERLLHYALYQIVHSFEEACCSAVFFQRADGTLELAAHYQRPNIASQMPLPLEALARRAIESGQSVAAGLDGEPQLVNEELLGPAADADALNCVYRALAVPLVRQGTAFGSLILTALRTTAPLKGADLSLLTAFAQQMATAIENVRLYEAVQEREARLQELVRRLVNAQEQERQRIARELHDETGQKLTALAMGLAAIEAQLSRDDLAATTNLVRNLRQVADQSIVELRNIMADLRPAQLDDLGLVPALRWYLSQYGERYPEIKARFVTDRLSTRLTPEQETVLFRVAQEALSNVARHARASVVEVKLVQQGDVVRLEVVDNGIGFDPGAPRSQSPGTGLGLAGMRERMALVGGTCVIESAPGEGTRVIVELPVRRET